MHTIYLDNSNHPFFQEAFQLYFEELGVNVNDYPKLFAQMNQESGNTTILLSDESKALGFIIYRIDELTSWFFSEKFGFIREFWIHPSIRRQGLATQLLRLAEEDLLNQSIHKIYLTSDTAGSFYLKNGFTINSDIIAKNEDPVFTKYLSKD